MIHLKHDLIFVKDSILESEIAFWKVIARNKTQCWTLITEDTLYTHNIKKVTYPKCLEIINNR